MKVSIITLGCRVNQAESDSLEATLKENGATIVELKDNPDVCIVNTCTVTAESDHNSRQLIRRASRAGSRVIVTGCYSQMKPSEVSAIPGVEKVIDNSRKDDIIGFLGYIQTRPSVSHPGRSRPYLKVQDGCNFRCAYCSVPFARGRSRSLPLDAALQRARDLEEAGFKEIVLTGIHLGTYGQDLPVKSSLSSLVAAIIKETRDCRVRLSSVEINEIDDELLDLMTTGRICRHLHIPLQSGSDLILTRMRRCYSASSYRRKLDRVVEKAPDISIGTDVIVGFPGENDTLFEETASLLREGSFSYLHVFPFSRRPGTEACDLDGHLPGEVIRERMKIMKCINGIKRRTYADQQIGKTLDVLLEQRIGNGMVVGTSGNYLKIAVSLDAFVRGTVVPVSVAEICEGTLVGMVIQ